MRFIPGAADIGGGLHQPLVAFLLGALLVIGIVGAWRMA